MTYDIVIVGNGILALSTAYRCLKKDPTLKISIVGPYGRPGSATFAAGAMLNACAELTNVSLNSDAGRIKFEMARRSSSLWLNWVNQINDDTREKDKLCLSLGTYIINNALSGNLDCENFETIIAALKEYGEDYEEINSKDIPGIQSFEGCRSLRSIFLPKEGHINTHHVIEALENILKENPNVTFIDDFVTEILSTQNQATGIITAKNGTISAPHILLAAGAFSQKLLDSIAEIRESIPPLFAGVGVSLLLKQDHNNPVHHVIRTPNRSGACGLHMLPRDEKTVYVGASNNVYLSPSTQVTAGIAHFLLQCAIEQLNQNFYKHEIIGWQVGNRPACIDTFPLLGPTSLHGLWLMTGTYRDGFHQSPLLADELSNMILGKSSTLNPLFYPERVPIKTRTVEQSIDEYVMHYLAASYEHRAQPPRFLQENGLVSSIRHKAEQWYDQLETDYGLAPDMLFMIDFATDGKEMLNFFKTYLHKHSQTMRLKKAG